MEKKNIFALLKEYMDKFKPMFSVEIEWTFIDDKCVSTETKVTTYKDGLPK